jgi:predicted transcriptional regulator
MGMSETSALTIRLPTEAKERLDRLARDSALSPSRLAADAVLAFLEEQERAREKIRAGLADVAAGRVVSHEEVARWLDSWGSEDELPPPRCD